MGAVLLAVALMSPAGPVPASARHADGTSRSARVPVRPGSARARAATIMCAKVAAKAGFSFDRTVTTRKGPQPQIVVAIAVAMAESGCTSGATNVNAGGSVDRGLWQINSRWHPEVSDRCAFQIQCNANASWIISGHGADWSPWSTFKSGAWTPYLADARAAIAGGFTFLLGNEGAGTCLNADGAAMAISQRVCDPGDGRQQWTVLSAAVGSPPILRNAATGSCLDWDGARTALLACDATDAGQRLSFLGTGRLNTNGNADALIQNRHDGPCVVADRAGAGKPVWPRACDSGDTLQMWN
ncbi:MAG: hypothetical protein ACJ786_36530 [Catenulispora sp.]